MTTSKTLLVMAGGTGGHVFPAIAVAKKLQQLGWQIHWLGTQDRMEAELVPKHDIPIHFISISGLKGKGVIPLLFSPFRILRAVWQATKIIKQIKPNAVLGMGGYVSGPGGVAAKLCGVPVILHEQNAVAGMTNRLLSKIATRVLQAFPNAFPNAEVVGNPVRSEFFSQPSPQQRYAERDGKLRVLVVGGSQGASILNQTLPKVTALYPNVLVKHQVGKGNIAKVTADYADFNDVEVLEFIDDIAATYAWADIVICRSGALTVSEIAAVGSVAIFIPFQHQDRQQYLNAQYLERVNGAKIIEQANLTPEVIIKLLAELTRDKLSVMASNAQKMATPLAAQRVADVIIDVAR